MEACDPRVIYRCWKRPMSTFFKKNSFGKNPCKWRCLETLNPKYGSFHGEADQRGIFLASLAVGCKAALQAPEGVCYPQLSVSPHANNESGHSLEH